MRQLRPFVSSQRWYDSLIMAQADEQVGPEPFQVLCENLLNTTAAYLIPTGPTAALIAAQRYPAECAEPALGSLAQQALTKPELILPIDPQQYGGAIWAVALWREQGMAGLLLLGPRRDNSLYTQEEVEIARSAGERLIDLAAGVALSQRLMRLQRERMTATQMLDQRTRRTLHDEVLPLIHTAMLSLASGATAEAAIQQLGAAHQEVSNLLRTLPPTVAPEIARLGLLEALKRMVAVEFAAAFDEVTWRCDAGTEDQAAHLSPLAAETLYYAAREAVRNAAKHARQPDLPAGLRSDADCTCRGPAVSTGDCRQRLGLAADAGQRPGIGAPWHADGCGGRFAGAGDKRRTGDTGRVGGGSGVTTDYGRISKPSQCRGRIMSKWRRSTVSTRRIFKRSATATREASTNPILASA